MFCLLCYFAQSTTIPCGLQFSTSVSDQYTIQSCHFFNLYCSGNGGAIDINASSSSLTVLKTHFSACVANDDGGAIDFLGNFIQINITCASDCCALNENGQFFHSYVNTSSTQIFYMDSMIRCSNSTLNGCNFAIMPYQGNQISMLFNSSYNVLATYDAGFAFRNPTSIDSSFLTIYNNTCHISITVDFSFVASGSFASSNIVSNWINFTYGIMRIEGSSSSSVSISSCIFLNNVGQYLFANGCQLTSVVNCWISLASGAFSNSALSTSNIQLATTSTYDFWSGSPTKNCVKIVPTAVFSAPALGDAVSQLIFLHFAIVFCV